MAMTDPTGYLLNLIAATSHLERALQHAGAMDAVSGDERLLSLKRELHDKLRGLATTQTGEFISAANAPRATSHNPPGDSRDMARPLSHALAADDVHEWVEGARLADIADLLDHAGRRMRELTQ